MLWYRLISKRKQPSWFTPCKSAGLNTAAEWVALLLHIQGVPGLNLRTGLATQTVFMIYLVLPNKRWDNATKSNKFNILLNPLLTNHAKMFVINISDSDASPKNFVFMALWSAVTGHSLFWTSTAASRASMVRTRYSPQPDVHDAIAGTWAVPLVAQHPHPYVAAWNICETSKCK